MPDTISFARGAPSPDLIPVEAMREATMAAFDNDWKTALSYGVGIGHPGLCAWLADRHELSGPEQVMVTNGSLEAGAMLFKHLLKPGDRVVVEQPSYDRTLLMLKEIGVEFVPVKLQEDGIDVDAVEAAIAEGPIKLAHIIPNFQNPAGVTLSRERRHELIHLAQERGIPILEDDFVGDLRYEGRAQPALKALDPGGQVIYISTFTKMLAPGLRVGYILADGPVLDALLAEARARGVRIVHPARVTDMVRDEAGFCLRVEDAFWTAPRVVLATGGLSLPQTGSDGSGYTLARSLGHSIVPTTPALDPLVLEGDFHAQVGQFFNHPDSPFAPADQIHFHHLHQRRRGQIDPEGENMDI